MAEAFVFRMTVVDAYVASVRGIEGMVEQLGASPLLDAMSEDELLEHCLDGWNVSPVEFDSESQSEIERTEIYDKQWIRQATPAQQIYNLRIPLAKKKSNGLALNLRPMKGWTQIGPPLGSKNIAFRERESQLVITGTTQEIQQLRDTVNRVIGLVNGEIEIEYGNLPDVAKNLIAAKRSKMRESESALLNAAETLGVVVRRKGDAPNLVDVRERESVRTIRKQGQRSAKADDYELDAKSIQAIVDVVDRSGRGFEIAPSEFVKLREEGLRHILAGYLNAVFEGTDATGETFVKNGKPDLVIQRNGQMVLVGECKFWDGQQLYLDTLESQLTRYLLWRHSVALLITFSRTASFSKTIEMAKQAATSAESFRSDIQVRSETYFVTQHEHPEETEKMISIHHLLFNLHTS